MYNYSKVLWEQISLVFTEDCKYYLFTEIRNLDFDKNTSQKQVFFNDFQIETI